MPEDRRERAFREELLETMFRQGPGEPGAGYPSSPLSEAVSQGGPEVASRPAQGPRADPRDRSRGWDDAEPELRRAWEARRPETPWEQVREAVRDSWMREHASRPSEIGSEETLQLREEELFAHKQAVEVGEVEIRKEVVTETRTIEVPVQREQLVIERRTGDRIEGEPIRIPLREQRTGEAPAGSVEHLEPRSDRSGS